jgi:hypothetical protein
VRKFGVKAPNQDRVVLHEAPTLEAERMALAKAGFGYIVVHEVVDGVSVEPLPDGLKRYSFMTSLLVNHADELREWLAEQGCTCQCNRTPPESKRRNRLSNLNIDEVSAVDVGAGADAKVVLVKRTEGSDQ